MEGRSHGLRSTEKPSGGQGVMETGCKGRMSGNTMSGPGETGPQGASFIISCSNNGNKIPSWYGGGRSGDY